MTDLLADLETKREQLAHPLSETRHIGFVKELVDQHDTTGLRAWVSAVSEWCYPHHPCLLCSERFAEALMDAAPVLLAIATAARNAMNEQTTESFDAVCAALAGLEMTEAQP